MADTNNTYTNIKDILKQFELQIVQKKHYTKDQTYSKSEVNTAIGNAIAGVHQFNIVKSTGASNTPQGVLVPTMGAGTDSETPGWTGTLVASSANAHTIYFVPSVNGLNDQYDEYMALKTGTNDYTWEKIGNTDVSLSGYVPTSRKINNKSLGSDITLTASDVGLGNVINVTTDRDITENSDNNITSGAVYSALNADFTSSGSAGILLSGSVNAPTITVTPGTIANNNTSFVTGGAVFTYTQPKDADLTAIANLTGTSGVLKKTAENTWTLDASLNAIAALSGTSGFLKKTGANTWTLDASTYLTTGTASSTYTAKTTTYNTSNAGVKLGGTSASPEITVTGGSVASGNSSVVTGGTVYSYITGSSGVLYISDSDFTTMLSQV